MRARAFSKSATSPSAPRGSKRNSNAPGSCARGSRGEKYGARAILPRFAAGKPRGMRRNGAANRGKIALAPYSSRSSPLERDERGDVARDDHPGERNPDPRIERAVLVDPQEALDVGQAEQRPVRDALDHVDRELQDRQEQHHERDAERRARERREEERQPVDREQQQILVQRAEDQRLVSAFDVDLLQQPRNRQRRNEDGNRGRERALQPALAQDAFARQRPREPDLQRAAL